MTPAKNLKALSEFCAELSHNCLTAIHNLGPKPTDASALDIWKKRREDLEKSMNELSNQAGILAALAINAALDEVEDDLIKVKSVTDQAQSEIKEIQKISDFIERVGKVVDLVTNVIALVQAPGSIVLQPFLDKITALNPPDTP